MWVRSWSLTIDWNVLTGTLICRVSEPVSLIISRRSLRKIVHYGVPEKTKGSISLLQSLCASMAPSFSHDALSSSRPETWTSSSTADSGAPIEPVTILTLSSVQPTSVPISRRQVKRESITACLWPKRASILHLAIIMITVSF